VILSAICLTKMSFRLMLVNGLLFDSRGECTPVFHMIFDTITARTFAVAITRLRDVCPSSARMVKFVTYFHQA